MAFFKADNEYSFAKSNAPTISAARRSQGQSRDTLQTAGAVSVDTSGEIIGDAAMDGDGDVKGVGEEAGVVVGVGEGDAEDVGDGEAKGVGVRVGGGVGGIGVNVPVGTFSFPGRFGVGVGVGFGVGVGVGCGITKDLQAATQGWPYPNIWKVALTVWPSRPVVLTDLFSPSVALWVVRVLPLPDETDHENLSLTRGEPSALLTLALKDRSCPALIVSGHSTLMAGQVGADSGQPSTLTLTESDKVRGAMNNGDLTVSVMVAV